MFTNSNRFSSLPAISLTLFSPLKITNDVETCDFFINNKQIWLLLSVKKIFKIFQRFQMHLNYINVFKYFLFVIKLVPYLKIYEPKNERHKNHFVVHLSIISC